MFGWCFVFLAVLSEGKALQDSLISDINSLSELPLEKLLHVKNSLEQEQELIDLNNEQDNNEESIAATLDTSQAQALHGKFKPYQRGSYETWQKKGGKKGLSTIFQITITALAFLAFAGYLLCLLVQAIKAKQTTTMMPTTAAAAVYLAPIRRRRPVRHRREIWPEADPDTLYYALKMFSEGYATYHTVDYKYYNFTVDSLG